MAMFVLVVELLAVPVSADTGAAAGAGSDAVSSVGSSVERVRMFPSLLMICVFWHEQCRVRQGKHDVRGGGRQ